MIFSTLILAAGAGTRMKSSKSKVAHELLKKPLVRWVVDAANAAGSAKVITVVGHEREQVIPLVEDTEIVVQEERLGTGHAVKIARDILTRDASDEASSLVVLCGDTPLITAETISSLVSSQQQNKAAICVLTHLLDDPTNYGRILRNAAGDVIGIVEEKDATDEQRAIKECNSGAYCFDLATLLESLDELSCDNVQGEYYLTDVVAICADKGLAVKAHIVDAEETQGINSRVQLAAATKSMQRRINEAHMMAGVTMLDPDLVWIGPDVQIENDVELLPLTMLYGTTQVAGGSVIGPNSRLQDSRVGKDCTIEESIVLSSTLEDEVSCGPRAYLRPGTVMKKGSKAGTHVEIKNSTIGEGSKVPHLSYFGDATLGTNVNIGAGSITCNYNGKTKSKTIIGDRSFVGSDTMLVAPVELGSDVTTGAGSVITKNVADGALAVERGDQTVIEGWTYRQEERQK
ncbi:MAG TPA: UDP-N-acetylglucosamine diphosphorylase/glucosamine-1-phosphate N-acetyltransferase [Coriobacteriia bacterium]|nr:UDP-N-acetylglucosamine diphosphorylase/glucosamine-1-phosphate N-acetyltransferase [Coriobacteriia bacterium]